MNFLARGLVLFGLSFLATSVFAQSEPDAAILKVNGQEVFQSDLELVKSMLPLERYKTTKARTNLIEGIYLEFLIQKTVLEQKGMAKVNSESVRLFMAQSLPSRQNDPRRSSYTAEGYAARELVEKAYLATIIWEFYERFYDQSQPDAKAVTEQQITASYVQGVKPPEVTIRAMLLKDAKVAKRLEKQIRSDADFERLARYYSLVRASVGGAYPGTERPESVRLNLLEPELQIGISKFAKRGIFRVAAPFNRVWLVSVLDTSKLQPKRTNQASPFELNPLRYSALGSLNFAPGDGYQIQKLTQLKSTVEILSPNLRQHNPTAVTLQNTRLGISSIFAMMLFLNEPETFADIESKISQEIETWLKRSVVETGLPYNGAGARDNGAGAQESLENYLAARVKVSENQLKSYYAASEQQFMFEHGGQAMACNFKTQAFANQMRNMFTLFTDDKWVFTLESPFDGHCDVRGGGEVPPLPEKPSRTSLKPVPGGFITKVFRYQGEFWFVVLYGYQPKPLLKPFALVRNEVEQEYRGLVAKKQLPAFEQALRKRVKAQNLLKQAMQELENAGK
jgi:hypothetical protein